MPMTPLRGGPARRAELLRAVLDVLRETGYDRLTVDAVAARAHASKQTIYRRWPSKADLVVAAFSDAVAGTSTPRESGHLRDDLLVLLDSLINELSSLGDVIAGLIRELRRNPDLTDAMRSGYIDTRRQALINVFDRARARGELAEDADVELLWQIAPSMIFFRMLIAGEPVDRSLAERLVDEIVIPLCGGSVTANGT